VATLWQGLLYLDPRVPKRIFDVIVAALALACLAPVLVLLALFVRWRIGSPVLFVQERPGLSAQPFNIFKFRTMTDERDSAGHLLPDGERLVPFGRFIRAASLDELPEFFNVIRGDMSLVGPRPLLREYLPLYTAEQARRHEVRPGITGWAQVNGRNALSWEERLRLDVWYVDHRSFWLDLRILWMTLIAVATRRGISQDGHATMEKFTGNR
jgi:sugar transferase EpsL